MVALATHARLCCGRMGKVRRFILVQRRDEVGIHDCHRIKCFIVDGKWINVGVVNVMDIVGLRMDVHAIHVALC